MDDLDAANRRLLACASFDAIELEFALAERRNAVRAIAASPSRPSVEQLRKAHDDGQLIRALLTGFYRDAEIRLSRIARARWPHPGAHELECIG